MQQLRPRLQSAEDFIARVHRMRADRYRLLAAWQDGQTAVALGGYRLAENLIYGRFLYVDDLVTLDTARGARWGQALMDAMARIGEKEGCSCLVLDTGLSNALAQRFYFRQGLLTQAMRFGRPLQSTQNGGGAAA
ncbi:MAG: GNAT family N-acetyltransferase [Pseudomonadota bacterium]